MLLTRDKFREAVFARDNRKCVFCEKHAKDAHHILERRLFSDGGYYLDNGASVCHEHHIKCETTEISVEDVRAACKIQKKIVPLHLYPDQVYDKWGNPVIENGRRLKGELFHDESVQKILKQGNMLDLFTDWVKYPRTYHLPWSEDVGKSDRIIQSLQFFEDKKVVVTEKMDGENTSMYSNHIHARSLDSASNSTRDWVKRFWANIHSEIPHGWRVCGENLFAKHSIEYQNLESYFLGFSVWNNQNTCLSWEQTVEWFHLFGIKHVPVLYYGTFDEKKIRSLYTGADYNTSEGYVLRVADSFEYKDFNRAVAKYVRKDHVRTSQHWLKSSITQNGLKE